MRLADWQSSCISNPLNWRDIEIENANDYIYSTEPNCYFMAEIDKESECDMKTGYHDASYYGRDVADATTNKLCFLS